MGEIIGAGVVSHVPTIVMPEDDRKRLNNGQDLSLVEGPVSYTHLTLPTQA